MWKCLLIGRVVAEPELKTVSGKAGPVNVATFDLAVNTMGETSFINGISAWGKQADQAAATFKKGTKLFVVTECKNRKYEKDGVTKTFQDHRLSEFQYLEAKKEEEGVSTGVEEPAVAPF